MFSFLKKSVSVKEIVEVVWDGIINWPSKYGDYLRNNFHLKMV